MTPLLLHLKRVPFSDRRYVLPLIALPFVLFVGVLFSRFSAQSPQPQGAPELSLSLGETEDSILTKNAAYDHFFSMQETPSALLGLQEEKDSLQALDAAASSTRGSYGAQGSSSPSYSAPESGSRELIRLINQAESLRRAPQRSLPVEPSSYTGSSAAGYPSIYSSASAPTPKRELSPEELMRRQMLLLDSLEKARDPEHLKRVEQQEKELGRLEEKKKGMLSPQRVGTAPGKNYFHGARAEQTSPFLSAFLDVPQSGYLGSRIALRILQDLYIGNRRLPRQSTLYAQVSGFTKERITLSVTSVLLEGKIVPVRLSVYDLDGLEGLYIPGSAFREMLLEMGSSSVQGTRLDAQGQEFYTSMLSSVLSSASRSASNLLRRNRVHLKSGTQIYLRDRSEVPAD